MICRNRVESRRLNVMLTMTDDSVKAATRPYQKPHLLKYLRRLANLPDQPVVTSRKRENRTLRPIERR